MKPTIKDLVAAQTWINEVKDSPAALKAFHLWQKMMVPSMITARLKVTAASAKIPYEDIALLNLAYEASMIAVAGLPKFQDLAKAIATSKFPATQWGCSCLGVTDRSGDAISGALHVRNLDWPDPGHLLRDSTVIHKEGGPTPYYTVGFPGQAGVLTGVATRRFSISMNAVYTDKAGWGAAPVYLIRKVLDESRSFDDALRVLCRTKLIVGCLFMLIEGTPTAAEPRMVVIERTPDQYLVRNAKTYGNNLSAIICTNDYLGIKPEEAGAVQTNNELQTSSCKRMATIERGLNNGPAQKMHQADWAQLMRSKDVQLPCTIHTVLMQPSSNEEPEVLAA